ncbi:uncharacterized protein LOC126611421 isoform X1 [Malus sylvestris]|uniref:uncharacterized protein LOC126611421 isoform X1 n=1 Tax=Malus sylvestris TaxID=3752 RepID=UPI0021ACD6EA|nr:uncharacterized protein LOC126611421 isoform X1 [Malus sylvestris]
MDFVVLSKPSRLICQNLFNFKQPPQLFPKGKFLFSFLHSESSKSSSFDFCNFDSTETWFSLQHYPFSTKITSQTLPISNTTCPAKICDENLEASGGNKWVPPMGGTHDVDVA